MGCLRVEAISQKQKSAASRGRLPGQPNVRVSPLLVPNAFGVVLSKFIPPR